MDARSLASVIGEDELSPSDKNYITFGKLFEKHFISQGHKNRDINETLDLGWNLLSVFPKDELDRVEQSILDQYYDHDKAYYEFELDKNLFIKELRNEAK
jgi:V/A-type H+-transporting ATPase subunit B